MPTADQTSVGTADQEFLSGGIPVSTESAELNAGVAGIGSPVFLSNGMWVAFAKSGQWGKVRLEATDRPFEPNPEWYTVEAFQGELVLESNRAFRLLGGLYYRLNAESVVDPIRVTFVKTLDLQIVPYQVQLPQCG